AEKIRPGSCKCEAQIGARVAIAQALNPAADQALERAHILDSHHRGIGADGIRRRADDAPRRPRFLVLPAAGAKRRTWARKLVLWVGVVTFVFPSRAAARSRRTRG